MPGMKKSSGETLCCAWMPLQPEASNQTGSSTAQISFPFNFKQKRV